MPETRTASTELQPDDYRKLRYLSYDWDCPVSEVIRRLMLDAMREQYTIAKKKGDA